MVKYYYRKKITLYLIIFQVNIIIKTYTKENLQAIVKQIKKVINNCINIKI